MRVADALDSRTSADHTRATGIAASAHMTTAGTWALFPVVVSFFFMLIAPEIVTPVGRFGYEAPVFALLFPFGLWALGLQGLLRTAPVILPFLSALISYFLCALESPEEVFTSSARSVAGIGRGILYITAGALCGRILAVSDMARVARWFIWFVAALLLFGFLQATSDLVSSITFEWYWQDQELDQEQSLSILAGRPASTFMRVFAYSFFTTTLFLTLLRTEAHIGTLLRIALCLASLFATVASQTKGAIIALFFGLIFVAVRSGIRTTLLYVLPGIILLAAILQYASDSGSTPRLEAFSYLVQGDVSTFASLLSDDPNVVTRTRYIDEQLEIFYEHPIFGNMLETDQKQSSDNLYIHMLAKMGIVGLFSILLVPWYFLSLSRRFGTHWLRSGKPAHLQYHILFCQLLAWGAFVGLVMGVSWNLFIANRAIVLLYFLCGLLEGQWNRWEGAHTRLAGSPTALRH